MRKMSDYAAPVVSLPPSTTTKTTTVTTTTLQSKQQHDRLQFQGFIAAKRYCNHRSKAFEHREHIEQTHRHQSRLYRSNRTWHVAGGMKSNLLVLVTAATAAALAVLASGTIAVQLKCTHRDEFLYASPASKCALYYRCYQGEAVRYRCNQKSAFDFYQQKCVRSEGTCYEPVCTGKTNGMYADTTHACRRSFECLGGQLVAIDNCPRGYLFDGIKCAPQHEVTCESAKTSAIAFPFSGDDRCYGRQNGNHIIDGDKCKKFMICRDNNVIDVFECPDGYAYNEFTKRCSFTGDFESSSCVSNFMDEGDDTCSRLADGAHLDPTSKNCRKFIQCMDGSIASRHECPRATVFNGIQCVPDILYHCPRMALIGDICDKKQDGFYIDPRKGCSYYVRCESQQSIEHYSCPSGLYYNPTRNMCMEHFIDGVCLEFGHSTDCHNRAAGYYQDISEQSKCSRYFYCFNGNKTIFHCKPGEVFDGENCISSILYTCPTADINSCLGKANGYYRDLTGGCRSYFYCSEGSKTSYLCSPGQMFSNGHCVDRLEDASCQDDHVCAGKTDGYYQDLPSQCRNYYYCQGAEKLQTLTCRGSKIFNGYSCVSQDSYICPKGAAAAANPLLNCVSRLCASGCSSNGFQNDYDSDCQNYFFCIDGKKTSLSCSNNYVFNGEICVPKDTYNCPKYCKDSNSCS